MPKKTILLVEDEAELRELASMILSEAGYKVLSAGNGRDALALFASDQPDAVLLDVMLPDMLGFEVCRRIRAGKKGAGTPVLFCTVRSAVASLAEGLKAGSTDYVIKPFVPKDLLGRLREALGEKA